MFEIMGTDHGYQRDCNTIGNLKMLTYVLTSFASWQKERHGNSKREGHNNLSLFTDFNLLPQKGMISLRDDGEVLISYFTSLNI